MDMELRGKNKKKGFKRFINSWGYSFDGLMHAFKHELSITIMIFITIIAVIGGFVLGINEMEWLFISVSIGIVLATELINTSIEATVDLVSPQIHPLAKIAKDTGSAAVFIFSIMAFVIACIIYIPNIIEFLGI